MTKDECIERISAFRDYLTSGNPIWDIEECKEVFDMAIKALEEPERKTGRWIDIDSETYTWKVRCDQCGHERSIMSTQGRYPRFCEGCGCKMVVNPEAESLFPNECPFCGGKAVVKEKYRNDTPNRKMYWVECTACGISQRHDGTGGYRQKNKAIKVWNTRANYTCYTLYK